ncbi:hypothetical protein BKA62DRAFT_644199 [Auriculariales sp. MPI-PUGE-AT-0066]|nr:hypothetical protein BKA62DRAFT_644199 [Auriculariales sp. MPI-PUGE-AT-0066]
MEYSMSHNDASHIFAAAISDIQGFWTTLVESHRASHTIPALDYTIEQIVSLLTFWLPCTIFVLLEVLPIPALRRWSKRHRLQQNAAPWTAGDLWHCVLVVGRNQLISSGIGLSKVLRGKQSHSFEPPIPSIWRVLWEFAACFAAREVLFYYSHRLLHHRRVYSWVHKVHHRWVCRILLLYMVLFDDVDGKLCRFTAPIALSAQYAHPVEHIVANLLPIALPAQILRIHALTWYAVSCGELLETSIVHSGFDFFARLAEFHDLHHELFRVNFGAVGVLDWYHGTAFYRSRSCKVNLEGSQVRAGEVNTNIMNQDKIE